jgi:hypothetical protein
MSRRSDLDRLTRRWRERHDARHPADELRPRANPGREALARRGFPYHDRTPEQYVAEHGAAMTGFTYDDESYADAELDAWILEVGRLLREQREGPAEQPKGAAEPAAEAPPKAAPRKAAKAAPRKAKAPAKAPKKPPARG